MICHVTDNCQQKQISFQGGELRLVAIGFRKCVQCRLTVVALGNTQHAPAHNGTALIAQVFSLQRSLHSRGL